MSKRAECHVQQTVELGGPELGGPEADRPFSAMFSKHDVTRTYPDCNMLE